MGLPGKAEISATTGPGLHVKHLNLSGVTEITIRLTKQVLDVIGEGGNLSSYDLADAGTITIIPANKMLAFSVKQVNPPLTAEQKHIDDDHAAAEPPEPFEPPTVKPLKK